MIIIKQGDPDAIKEYKRFECKRCGCVWEAEKGEYKTDDVQYNEPYAHSTCPTCGKEAYISVTQTLYFDDVVKIDIKNLISKVKRW